MSCWVVPTIAAEIWGVSVDHVLARVRDGDLAYRTEEGFTFVDVAPGGCVAQERPPTFTALSEAELEALRSDDSDATVDAELDDEAADNDGLGPAPEDEERTTDLGDWRAVRQRVSVTRIPPRRVAPPAAAA